MAWLFLCSVEAYNQKVYKQFLQSGHFEGVSFLLLLGVAMPLKYKANLPMAVTIAGTIHGVLFIVYIAALLRAHKELGWTLTRSFLAFLLSIIPFGTFFLNKLK